MPAWNALTPQPPEPTSSTFVGRGQETALLHDAWRRAADGERQVVFIGGEPGAGKSRLITQTVPALASSGAAALVGSCPEDLGAAYEPFLGPLTALLPSLLDGSLPLEPDARIEVAQVAALVQTVIGAMTPGGSDRVDDRIQRRDVLDAVVESLRAAAAQQPLVLVLEDLHWAGETALQLLSPLVSRTVGCPMLILATHRSTAPDRSAMLVHHITALYRLDGVRRLDLAPLDAESIADYLILEGAVSPGRAQLVAPRLRELTGGNPFFLRELCRSSAGEGAWSTLTSGDPKTPQSVQDTLEDRLRTLSPAARATLEVAAVIGESVPTGLLVTACEVEAAATLSALDSALNLHLLEPEPGAEDRLRFPHALARHVVMDLMAPSRRAALHAQVAEALERQGPPSVPVVQQLARLYSGAHLLGYDAQAVHYLRAAADIAGAALAHRESAALIERAIALERDPDACDGLRLQAAHSHILAGDLASSRRLCEAVAARHGSAHQLDGATAYEDSAWRTAEPGLRAVELLSAAFTDLEPDLHDARTIRARAGLGRALANSGHPEESTHLAERTIAQARALGDQDLLADVLLASVNQGQQHPVTATVTRSRAEELSAHCYHTGNLWHLGPAAYARTTIAYLQGDLQRLLDAQADLRHVAEASRQPYFGVYARCVDFGRQLMAGQLQAASDTSEGLLEAEESFADRPGEPADGPFGVRQFMIRRENGALAPVRTLVTGEEDPATLWAPGLVALYTELQLADPARRALWWLLDRDLDRQRSSGAWPGTLAFLCEATVYLHDLPAAQLLRPFVEQYAGTNLAVSPFVAVFGSADRYRGELDSLLGTGDPEPSFAAAEQMATRMDAPLHRAHALAAHVLHHRRRGSGACDVVALETEVRALANDLGLIRVLRALGDSRPAGVGQRSRDGLTPRELRVLGLLGRGMTNREVATELFISENTAANHVRSILMKTGSENRTQAALYAAEHGLIRPG